MERVPPTDMAELTYLEVLGLGRRDLLKHYLQALLNEFRGNLVAAGQRAGLAGERVRHLARKYGANSFGV